MRFNSVVHLVEMCNGELVGSIPTSFNHAGMAEWNTR